MEETKDLENTLTTETNVEVKEEEKVEEQYMLFKKEKKVKENLVNTEAVELSVLNLQGQVSTLVGEDKERSVRSIATDIATKIAGEYYNQILNNAPGTLDTLGEIAAWIETHPDLDDIVQLIQRVGTLESDVSTLKPQVEGLQTNLGKLAENVSGLQLNFETLETNHSNLNALVLQIQASVQDNAGDIADIYTRLSWQELYEE